MRLLNEVKPEYFLLENVLMGEKWEKVLTKAIGVKLIMINSALVSAQNRKRLYWTNIGMKASGLFGDMESTIEQPKDKGILLKDILEDEVDEKYFLSEKAINSIILNEDNLQKSNVNPNKSNSLQSPGNACGIYKGASYIVHNMQQRNPNRPSTLKNKNAGGSGHLTRSDGKTYCLDSQQSNAVEIIPGTLRTHKDGNGFRELKNDKAGTIPARAREDGSGQNVVSINSRIRRLTPIECERLQTVKDNYTNYVSDSQRYKMLGNGWTIDVISHILNYIK